MHSTLIYQPEMIDCIGAIIEIQREGYLSYDLSMICCVNLASCLIPVKCLDNLCIDSTPRQCEVKATCLTLIYQLVTSGDRPPMPL